jgi:hypothetical protein
MILTDAPEVIGQEPVLVPLWPPKMAHDLAEPAADKTA